MNVEFEWLAGWTQHLFRIYCHATIDEPMPLTKLLSSARKTTAFSDLVGRDSSQCAACSPQILSPALH